jgi:hypothetical protein
VPPDTEVANYIRSLMHSCPTNPDVVRIAVELNAILDRSAQSETVATSNERITYRGFSYGVGSAEGVASLRRAIKENGDG